MSSILLPPAFSPRHVKALTVYSHNDPDKITALNSVPPDYSLETLEHELRAMALAPDPETRKIQALYMASIFKINTGVNPSATQPCIVCDGQHRFDSCEVLKNTDFLRGHYIWYCQQLCCETASRASTFGNVSTSVANPGRQQHPIHFVDGAYAPPDDMDPDADDPQDFQMGRR